MRLEDIKPLLAVNNMDETIGFYDEVLGFACVSRMEGWAR